MTECTEKIMGILEPRIGRGLAKSALKIKCRKLGIDPEHITPDEVMVLADDLYEPLRIFAGEEFAETTTTMIKAITRSAFPEGISSTVISGQES
jgi:hypothetical protein